MSLHFFIVGAQRSGTTFVANILDSHPQIVFAKPFRPEPKFFLGGVTAPSEARGVYYARYFQSVPSSIARLGEKSTSYLEVPGVSHRIFSTFPDADIVCILRDPVERAISNAKFSKSNGFERAPLDEALLRELESPSQLETLGRYSSSVNPYTYLARGLYRQQLERYYAVFPRHQLHVFTLESLISNPQRLLDMCETLGVDPARTPPIRMSPVNESPNGEGAVSTETRARLRDFFKQPNSELAALLSLDLSGWAS